MPRLLFAALLSALLVGTTAGVASARLAAAGEPTAPRVVAPFRVSQTPPPVDPARPGTYGYRSGPQIGRQIEAEAANQHAPHRAPVGAGASVTVSATVLPVVILVVGARGELTSVFTNTGARDGRSVIYLVRRESIEGSEGRLNNALWRRARSALAESAPGSGVIWTR